jgi:transcriptional regulator with XRE-family HTH domain
MKTRKKPISPEHQKILDKIGQELKRRRDETGLSYTALAKEIGMDKNSYYYIESAKVICGMVNLLQILDYYEITLSEFFQSID